MVWTPPPPAVLCTSDQHQGPLVRLVEEAAVDGEQGAPQNAAFGGGDPQDLWAGQERQRTLIF